MKETYPLKYVFGPISPDTADGRTIYMNNKIIVVKSNQTLPGHEITALFRKGNGDGKFNLARVNINQKTQLAIDGSPLEINWMFLFDEALKKGDGFSGIFEFTIYGRRYRIGFPLTEDEFSQSKLSLLPQTSDGRIAVPFLRDEKGGKEVLFVIPRPWIDWPRNCFEGITPKTSPEEIVKMFGSLGFGIVLDETTE